MQCVCLQEGVASLKAELKASKHKTKQLAATEKKLAQSKERHEEEKADMHQELEQMRDLLANTSQQLKREGEARIRDLVKVRQGLYVTSQICTPEHYHELTCLVTLYLLFQSVWGITRLCPGVIILCPEHCNNHVDLELSHSRLGQEQVEIASQRKQCSKVEQSNRKLREELRVLQEHVAEDVVPRTQMEAYKKEVDDKVDIVTCLELTTHLLVLISVYAG